MSQKPLLSLEPKLGPWQTYFSLMKGFVAIGFLWMPKNCLNGGWAFSLAAMAGGFAITLFSLFRLLEARERVPGGSYSQIAEAAMGPLGRLLLETFLCLMLYGFIVAFVFFAIVNLQDVFSGVLGMDVP